MSKMKTYLWFLALAAGLSAEGQKELKSWNTAQLDLALTRKLDIRFSHLRAYNLSQQFIHEFNQSAIHVDYDLTKKFSLSAGVTLSPSLSNAEGKNRVSLRATHKVLLADALSWSNSLQAELHSAIETRYRERMIFITRLGMKKRLNFLRISPSVSWFLFYNIGGNPVQYYDAKTGDPVAKQAANGFHRGRLNFNLNSKISRHLSLSVYYMMQREFNLFTDEFHRINVVNPNTGKVVRPFDNFSVLGLSFSYGINLYREN